MSFDKRPIVFGLLLSLGAAGGFALSSEVSPAVMSSFRQHKANAGGGGEGGAGAGSETQQGGAGAGTNGSGQAGAGHGGDEAAAGEGAGNRAKAEREKEKTGRDQTAQIESAGEDSMSTDAPSKADSPRRSEIDGAEHPCRSIEITGSEAASFLSGNTATDLNGKGPEPEIIYFAPRGLIARIHPTSMTIRNWNVASATLCGADAQRDSVRECDVIHARKCLDADQAGFHIGDLRHSSGRWMPVVRGNSQNFPRYIPYFDASLAGSIDGKQDKTTKMKIRRKIVDNFDRFSTYRYMKQSEREGGKVVFYEDTGRRFEFTTPTVDQIRNGVPVKLGWWKRAHQNLCEGEAHNDVKATCWIMKSGQEGHISLTATNRSRGFELVALGDVEQLKDDGDE